MLKFLKFGRFRDQPVVESQRQGFQRLLNELNETIDVLPEKPKVTIDPGTGHVDLEMPEQFPDEALALPAPDQDEDPARAEVETPKAPGAEKVA